MKYLTYEPCVVQLQVVGDRMWRPHEFRPGLKSTIRIQTGNAALPTGRGKSLSVALRPQSWACALVTYGVG